MNSILKVSPVTSLICLSVLFSVGCSPTTPNASSSNPKQISANKEAHKINRNLLELENQVRTKGVPVQQAAATQGIETSGEGISLDIVTSQLDENVEKKFQIPGVTVRHFSRKYNRVSVVISDPQIMHELANIPEVTMISPEYGGTTQPPQLGSPDADYHPQLIQPAKP